MPSVISKSSLSGLPKRLVLDQLMSEPDALAAIADAQNTKQRFVAIAINNYSVNAKDLAYIAGQEFGLPIFDLDIF